MVLQNGFILGSKKGGKHHLKVYKNKKLWIKLDNLSQRHTIEWKWVKGHSGHPENERADELANIAIEENTMA